MMNKIDISYLDIEPDYNTKVEFITNKIKNICIKN